MPEYPIGSGGQAGALDPTLFASLAQLRRAFIDPMRDSPIGGAAKYVREPDGTLATATYNTTGFNAALADGSADGSKPVVVPPPPAGQFWNVNGPLLMQDGGGLELLGGAFRHYPGNNFPMFQLAYNLGALVPEQWFLKAKIHGNFLNTLAGAGGVLVEVLGASTTGPRTDVACATTNGSPTVADAAIVAGDVGKAVTGAGIPANVIVNVVTAGVSFTMKDARTGAAVNATATANPVALTISGNNLEFADMMPVLDINGRYLRDYIVKCTGSAGGARAFKGYVRGRTCAGKGLWINSSDHQWVIDIGSCYEECLYMDGGSAKIDGKVFFAGYANAGYPADVGQTPQAKAGALLTTNAARSILDLIVQDCYGHGVDMQTVAGVKASFLLDTNGWLSDGATTTLANLNMNGCADNKIAGSISDRGAGPSNPTGDYGARFTGAANTRNQIDLEMKGAGGGASPFRRGRLNGYSNASHPGNDIRINGGRGGLQTVTPVTRVDAAAATTNGSATVADAAVVAGDVGRAVSGPGIPAGAVVNVVTAGVSFTMKDATSGAAVNATATANPVSIMLATPITLDLMDGNIVILGLPAGNIVIANPQADAYWTGMEVELHLKQDGTGGRTIVLGSLWKTSSDFALDATPNETSVLKFRYDGSKFRNTGSVINVPA